MRSSLLQGFTSFDCVEAQTGDSVPSFAPNMLGSGESQPLVCLHTTGGLRLRSMGCLPADPVFWLLLGDRVFQMMPEKDEALGESCFQGLWRYNKSIIARVNPCTGFPLPWPQLVRSGRRGSRTPSSWRRCRRHALGRGRS